MLLVNTSVAPEEWDPSSTPPSTLHHLRSEVWDTSRPLALGYPFRWSLERTEKGIELRRLDARDGIGVKDSCTEIGLEELPDRLIPLRYERPGKAPVQLWLKICPVTGLPAEPLEGHAPSPISVPIAGGAREENKIFAVMTAQVFVGIGILLLLNFLFPRKKSGEEAIIPPQFAKTLLTPAFKRKLNEQIAAGARAARSEPVSRALASAAVRSSIKRLLNGGSLSSLSSISSLGATSAEGASAQVFASGAPSPFGQANSGELNLKSADVSLLGGDGTSGQKAGYGSGIKAGVAGQGNAQVELAGQADMKVEEGLSKDEVGRVIHQHLGEVRYCYSAALVRNPAMEGKLVIDFTIDAEGQVSEATA
jgi:hypothetical protein